MAGISAIYPGSFDPITNGHVGIIKRSLIVFDRLIIAIAINTRKKTLFTVEERAELIRKTFKDDDRVEVDSFSGLTIEYCKKRGAKVILRGLRAVADFEYELQMVNMNKKLEPSVETLLMMTSEEHFFVSSRSVKEVASFNGNIDILVPPHVATALRKKYRFSR
ncbi:MAG: pantetheine-phosphate adenylyltransferase [Pseudomonadota bacterium]